MMPQSKTDASKLRKYLSQQKRRALAGPPQTHTSSVLQSLLVDGKDNQTKKKNDRRRGTVGTVTSVNDGRKQSSVKRKINSGDHNGYIVNLKKVCGEKDQRNIIARKEKMKRSNSTFSASGHGNDGLSSNGGMWNKVQLIGSQENSKSSSSSRPSSGLLDDLDVKPNKRAHTQKNRQSLKSVTLKKSSTDDQKCVKPLGKVGSKKRPTSEVVTPSKPDDNVYKDVQSIGSQNIFNAYEKRNEQIKSNHTGKSCDHTTTNGNSNVDIDIESSSSEMKSIFSSSFLSNKRSISKGRIRSVNRFLQTKAIQHKNGESLKERNEPLSSSNKQEETKSSLSQSLQCLESHNIPIHSSCQEDNQSLNTSTIPPIEEKSPKNNNIELSLQLPCFNRSNDNKGSKSPISKLPTLTSTKADFKPNEKKKSKKPNNDNFVKLNLRNKAGSCRGARNLNQHKRQKRWNAKMRELKNDNYQKVGQQKFQNHDEKDEDHLLQHKNVRRISSINDAIDPIDDYLDGTFHENSIKGKHDKSTCHIVSNTTKKADTSSRPLCSRHNRQCQLLVVKKNTTGNKGRKFYVCSMPKGEQCDFFQWEDDTVEATQRELLEASSYSGFVARQVAAYNKRLSSLTVPELRVFAKQRKLNSSGQKKSLLARLSVWVRDEICKSVQFDCDKRLDSSMNDVDEQASESISDCEESNVDENDDDDTSSSSDTLEICRENDDDDHSASSGELEICNSMEGENSISVMKGVEKNNDNPTMHAKSKLHEALFSLFGYTAFRDGQEWAITRCLEKKRSLLVAPTGMGKSLCYALPAALMDGICIVVSPLIALIEDQLRHLPPRIPSATLSGNISKKQMALIIDDVIKGRYKILFVSPEKLTSSAFRRMLQPKYCQTRKSFGRQLPPVSLLCLDEAHCLSQWGHNFRSSYLRIKAILDCMAPQSVLALTATAGPPVINDICNTLRIKNPTQDIGNEKSGSMKILNCNRNNIEVSAQLLDNEDERLQKLMKLLKVTTKKHEEIGKKDLSEGIENNVDDKFEGLLSEGSVIVYVWRKKDAEIITEQLVGSGVLGGVVCYHGGMDSNARSKAQAKFMRGKARICVATVAFGLGINKPDVRGVVHLCLPSSPENYLQEIGRAGRDNVEAKAIALVLKSELCQKHSLSFSNTLCFSQVEVLHNILESTVQTASEQCFRSRQNQDELDLKIAIPIVPLIGAVDVKEETIHTFLSLLEDETKFTSKMINIEGIIPDIATITLKRRTIEELAKIEEIGRCILDCGNVIEKRSINSVNDRNGGTALENGFSAYSFGSIEFSVTCCARSLGPKAEPRNIYAALRRLQRNGELELKFKEGGKSIFLKVNSIGLKYFMEKRKSGVNLTSCLFDYFSLQDRNQSSKVLEMFHIIQQISGRKCDGESMESTELFQEMINAYFDSASAESAERTFDKDILSMDESDKVAIRMLSNDVVRIVNEFPKKCPSNAFSSQVMFGSREHQDYTALLICKIFHGISSPSTPAQSWYGHILWAKWKMYNFKSLHNQILRVVQQS